MLMLFAKHWQQHSRVSLSFLLGRIAVLRRQMWPIVTNVAWSDSLSQ